MIYALHGFLGFPTDWHFLENVTAPFITAENDFQTWAKKFNAGIKTEGNILIGYSMGGRLALHAWKENPSLWRKLILVSTHPGLTPSERGARLKNDVIWADRFLNEPWEPLMQAWNNQPVLKDFWINRQESHYSRENLALQLKNFSLGHQEIITPENAIWIAGEKDEKFKKLMEPILVPHAGHRILHENPFYLKKLIMKEVS